MIEIIQESGARDGTRTRDLCRDRAEKAKHLQCLSRLSSDLGIPESAESISPVTHFVRFPDNHGRAFQAAVRTFGPPAFLHRKWDQRAQRDIAPRDLVVFAEGDADQPVSHWNGDDQFYDRENKR
jgi:hypothetical protein